MNYKLKEFQIKQNKQLNVQWAAFYNSNKHKNKKNWSQAQRGESKARIIFVVNQAIRQKWKSLPTNKAIAEFAECQIRWVQKVINKFLGIRKWLLKMKNNVRLISTFPIEKKIDIKEIAIKTILATLTHIDKYLNTWNSKLIFNP